MTVYRLQSVHSANGLEGDIVAVDHISENNSQEKQVDNVCKPNDGDNCVPNTGVPKHLNGTSHGKC